jgi:hypothetical protein
MERGVRDSHLRLDNIICMSVTTTQIATRYCSESDSFPLFHSKTILKLILSFNAIYTISLINPVLTSVIILLLFFPSSPHFHSAILFLLRHLLPLNLFIPFSFFNLFLSYILSTYIFSSTSKHFYLLLLLYVTKCPQFLHTSSNSFLSCYICLANPFLFSHITHYYTWVS